MDSKILLVDDEKDIVGLMEEALQKEGFHRIGKAYTGADAFQICRDFQPNIIVLNIMLPDIDGLEVCKQIRGFSYCSILFLSSQNDDVDKILGLSCGGDDYITKPFSLREVVYRIKAQLRRQQYQTATPDKQEVSLTVGPLSIDRECCRAYKGGREIGLTGRDSLLNRGLSFTLSKDFPPSIGWRDAGSSCLAPRGAASFPSRRAERRVASGSGASAAVTL